MPGYSPSMNIAPFVGVTTDSAGNYTGLIPAAENGYTASSGALCGFAAVFTGNLLVNTPGDITLTLLHQDGFVMGIGNSASRVSGPLAGVSFLWTAKYTPEPRLFGNLVVTEDSCGGVIVRLGNLCKCGADIGFYEPISLNYTDPAGRVYTIGGDGSLKSVTDVSGNRLTVTANGITASNGLTVPFVRDGQGRITKITDPLQREYLYGYDAAGDLTSVTYPGVATAAQYTYDLALESAVSVSWLCAYSVPTSPN